MFLCSYIKLPHFWLIFLNIRKNLVSSFLFYSMIRCFDGILSLFLCCFNYFSWWMLLYFFQFKLMWCLDLVITAKGFKSEEKISEPYSQQFSLFSNNSKGKNVWRLPSTFINGREYYSLWYPLFIDPESELQFHDKHQSFQHIFSHCGRKLRPLLRISLIYIFWFHSRAIFSES